MSPDPLFCILQDMPDEMVPDGMAHVVPGDVEDDQGSSMMDDDHVMGSGFFSRPVGVAVA
jgi:hypothetical protein